jgi:hypothetical protein
MGLSLKYDHDDEHSAISELDRLWVGVIVNEVGTIVVGDMAYVGKDSEAVMEPMEFLDAMLISSIWSYSGVAIPSIFFLVAVGIPSLKGICSVSAFTDPPNMYLDM